MTRTAIIAIALISIAAPAMADRTTQRPIEECVVIRQEGPIWNATPEQVARGVSFPCEHGYNQALRDYTTEIRRQEDEFCPRCCCNSGWEKR
jgi:hypothetical protein